MHRSVMVPVPPHTFLLHSAPTAYGFAGAVDAEHVPSHRTVPEVVFPHAFEGDKHEVPVRELHVWHGVPEHVNVHPRDSPVQSVHVFFMVPVVPSPHS